MTTCPAGHGSEEQDYCSVCGARIVAAARGALSSPQRAFVDAAGDAVKCPSCGDLRDDADARFCEVCRFDFVDRRPGPPPVAHPLRQMPSAPSAPLGPRGWALIVAVDASLDVDPDPDCPCPVGESEIVLLVDKPDLLVGRHDDTRAIHPEISLRDPGASRRHAKFVLEPDGVVALQDLASTNGTQINGEDVMPGTRTRLREGDRVTLGRWTRITLRGGM